MKKRKLFANKKIVSIAVIVAFAALGTLLIVFTKAATPTAVLSLTPASGSINQGSDITVGVYEDSGTQSVNSVSVGLSFDSSKFTVKTVSTTGSPFGSCVESALKSPGLVSVICFIIPSTSGPNSVTGKQLVANVTLTATAGTGSSSISFFKDTIGEQSGVFLASVNGENIWNGVTTGGTYTFTTPDTVGPVVSPWISPTASEIVNGQKTVSTTITDDRGTVSSVNLKIGNSNTLYAMTKNGDVYSYSWNTATVPDGPVTLTISATDPTGNPATGTLTRTVQVLNNKPNLSVGSITLSPAAPNTGDSVTVSAIVTNNGSTAIASGTSFTTTFSAGGSVFSTVANTAGLAIGASRTITSTIPWSAARGSQSIGVVTDTTNAIAESNEQDNSGSKSIVVYTLGDANNNGSVTIDDLNAVLNNWGTGTTRDKGDVNMDGKVSITDLNLVINNWTR